MSITKQNLARKRNWLKFKLLGLHIHYEEEYVLPEELVLIEEILSTRKTLIKHFDEGSRKLGLKVPKHKCWCGKEGKYTPKYDCNESFVCKEHIKI